nr:uncharacterized protein LOC101803678 [Anas platyrhynchos]
MPCSGPLPKHLSSDTSSNKKNRYLLIMQCKTVAEPVLLAVDTAEQHIQPAAEPHSADVPRGEQGEKEVNLQGRMASELGSRAALRLHVAVPSPGMGSPAALATGDLAGDMEALAVTAPEAAQKDVAGSQAEVDALKAAAAVRGEMESLKGSSSGNVVNPDGAAVEGSENPEADRVAEAFAQAVERIAKAEVTKVLQSAIAELKEKKRSVWLKQRNTIQTEEEDWVKEGEMI